MSNIRKRFEIEKFNEQTFDEHAKNLTFYQIVCDHNFEFQLLNAFRIDFFHFCNIEFHSFNFMKVIFCIMILYNNMLKDENENVKQKKIQF